MSRFLLGEGKPLGSMPGVKLAHSCGDKLGKQFRTQSNRIHAVASWLDGVTLLLRLGNSVCGKSIFVLVAQLLRTDWHFLKSLETSLG